MIDNNWLQNKKEMSRVWLDQTVENYYEATEPYISKIQQGYRWTETTSIKTACREASIFAESLIYTPENQFRLVYYAKLFQRKYITSSWTYVKDIIYKYLVQLRHQIDDYIKSGSIESLHRNENVKNEYEKDDGNNGIMEDKLKRTAKKILDYIDQINKESANTGMKQDEAREKAQEIIKSITGATTNGHVHKQKVININEESTNVDKIAYEIQEIMELASTEKMHLNEQLDLVQSRLSILQTTEGQETQLLFPALKAEIDHLRAIAENNVRQRTKSSLQLVQGMNANPNIKNRMKEDLESAQRAALKDLRQVYVKLYQTNKLIDELIY
ncbi:hypothetical protein INT46_010780 [Mucor plumbeus]|uniref:Uncharacterized protein n=1 Tax=Mucor plumbeus TaxID=97098 RepID=A0A8H7QM87_9FUNG|nr:hypothetical protein INT46_010780 [Mucor plumbeus]